MPQSLAKNLVHVIFSTKERKPFLTRDIRPELNSYLAGALRNLDCPAIIVGSTDDHVHMLFCLSKNYALTKIMREIKMQSSKWIKSKGAGFAVFQWQRGYGSFSVSQSMVDTVKSYIANQEKHHKKISFQDELRNFLIKHEMEVDERYLWD